MLKTTALIVLALLLLAVACVLLIAATRPDHFRIERSALIAAPAERLFPLIDNLREMNRWNPFDRKDPQIKGSYSGPAAGPGATYAFEGSREAGSGQLKVESSQAPSQVRMTLDMTRPMAAHNQVEFTLQPEAGGTRVTWAMSGEQPFIGRVMGVVIDIDRMVGGEFEKGLADLAAIATSAPAH
ncbi:MAG: SRPBCC family protein [Leptothrix sp. (in: b-proteobacteria)]